MFQNQAHVGRMLSLRRLCPRAYALWLPQSTRHYPSTVIQPLAYVHTTNNLPAVSNSRKSKKHIVRPKGIKRKYVQEKEVVTVWKQMTVKELAEVVNRSTKDLFEGISILRTDPKFGGCIFPRRANDPIEENAVIKGLTELTGHKMKYKSHAKVEKEDLDEYPLQTRPDAVLKPRAPVVAIMGHVDHGKTTLLDSLRHSRIVDKEFGGITQHIGAFSVAVPGGAGGGRITFLDTPGHAAFSSMRERGANSVDMVILVVAADDGIMRQTKESLRYAQAAKDPIIVAINKIDKPEADIEGTKRQLLSLGVELEEYGGDTQVVCVSALKGTGLDDLQEAILAQAELLQLEADVSGRCEGIVLEARNNAVGRGKVATVLLKHGTLKRGQSLVAGRAYAKVRTIHNDLGKSVNSALPAVPVEVSGWRELPEAGDIILEVPNEHRAHEVLRHRAGKTQEELTLAAQPIIQQKRQEHDDEYHRLRAEKLEIGFFWKRIYNRSRTKETIQTHTGPELSVVVKADVMGSVEAILDMFALYRDDRCRLSTIEHGVGSVTSADVELAAPFSGIIYAFNVKVESNVVELALSKGVTIRTHNVIYNLYDDVKEELNKCLPVALQEEILGEATVLAHISISNSKKKVPVAGCRCTKGSLKKKALFKLIRGDNVLYDGPAHSLKHLKNEVESVKTNVECGIRFEDPSIIPAPLDKVVCYSTKDVIQEVEWELEV